MSQEDKKLAIITTVVVLILLLIMYMLSSGMLKSSPPKKIKNSIPTAWIETEERITVLPKDTCDGEQWHSFDKDDYKGKCIDIDVIKDGRGDSFYMEQKVRLRYRTFERP